ncbi:hypothetical protein ACFX12_019742 [Malus domestica]
MEKEHVRGRNWTFDEDIALCLAWISVSEDGDVDTNQNRKVLWGKIVDKFHENSNAGRREVGGVYDQWKIIKTITQVHHQVKMVDIIIKFM